MTQLFSNGVDTTLAASLAIGGTSATLTDGSMLSTPTGGDFELITLSALESFEIVKVTARSANAVTIVRAQEGTAAAEWPAGTRVVTSITAGGLDLIRTPDPVEIGVGASASGAVSMAVGPGAVASGNPSVAVGIDALASGTFSTAMGPSGAALGSWSAAFGEGARAENQSCTSFGAEAYSQALQATAVGAVAKADDQNAVAVGAFSEALGWGSVVVGSFAQAQGDESTAIGLYSNVIGPRSIGLGFTNIPGSVERVFQVGALPAVPMPWGTTPESTAAYTMSGSQSVIMTQPLDLKTLQTRTIPIPLGATFFPEEVGVIITDADGVTGQPTIRFGITGDETKFLAATATAGMDAVHDRHVYGALSSTDGAKTLRAEVTVAATGTTLRGRIYWKGFAVVDNCPSAIGVSVLPGHCS